MQRLKKILVCIPNHWQHWTPLTSTVWAQLRHFSKYIHHRRKHHIQVWKEFMCYYKTVQHIFWAEAFLKTRILRSNGLLYSLLYVWSLSKYWAQGPVVSTTFKPAQHIEETIFQSLEKTFHSCFHHFINASGNWKITLFTTVYSEARGGKMTEDDKEDYKRITMPFSSSRWRKEKEGIFCLHFIHKRKIESSF